MDSINLLKEIEAQILDIALKLLEYNDKNPPVIKIKKTRNLNIEFRDNIIVQEGFNTDNLTLHKYGIRKSQRMFAVYLSLFSVIHGNLCANSVCTKRDIFYRNKELYKDQPTVDQAIENIAATFKVPRSCLNIAASGKGLFYGNVTLKLTNGHNLTGASNKRGSLIPSADHIDRILCHSCTTAIVIEKETCFLELLPLADKYNLLLVCGKGYPDVVTREFLNKLAGTDRPRMIAFTDADPFGYEIALTYQSGSMNFAHLNRDLAAPDLVFGGLTVAFILKMLPQFAPHLLLLARSDRKKAQDMLQRPWLKSPKLLVYRKELQRLLFVGYKAELEIFSSFNIPMNLGDYIHFNLVQIF